MTWAEATGSAYSIGTASRAPVTMSGSKSPSRAEIAAPILRSGSATRPIGRDLSEASPVRNAVTGCVPRTPSRSLAAVPELPRSRTVSGSASPPMPVP